MYDNLFRITSLYSAMAMILAACSAQAPTPVPAAEQPIATKAVPTATEIASTNTPESTDTQGVLGNITGIIAFVSNRDGNNEIYVMNGDGSGLANLTNNLADDGREDYGPVWSPSNFVFQKERIGS